MLYTIEGMSFKCLGSFWQSCKATCLAPNQKSMVEYFCKNSL